LKISGPKKLGFILCEDGFEVTDGFEDTLIISGGPWGINISATQSYLISFSLCSGTMRAGSRAE